MSIFNYDRAQMKQELARVTNPRKNSKKMVYALEVEKYIPILSPPKALELDNFDPNRYFITSGDAVNKAKQLSKDLWKYAGRARQAANRLKKKRKNVIEFERRCWESAGRSKTLISHLVNARGSSIFIETEWGWGNNSGNRGQSDDRQSNDGSILYVIPKNPRTYKPEAIAR